MRLRDIFWILDTKNSRATITKWAEKAGKNADAIIEYVEGAYKETNEQLAVAYWLCTGEYREPEIKQALYICKQKKLDPLKQNPKELVQKYPDTKPKEKPINPDDTIGRIAGGEKDEEGNVLYTVEKSDMQACRDLINTHFGKDASPWCLLQGDGEGNLKKDAEGYWDRYNAYPKKIVFRDGKLIAFSAGRNKNLREYWDRFDRSFPFVPYVGKQWEGKNGLTYEIGKGGSVFVKYGSQRGRLSEGYAESIEDLNAEVTVDEEDKTITMNGTVYSYREQDSGKYLVVGGRGAGKESFEINPKTLKKDGPARSVSINGDVIEGRYKNDEKVGTWIKKDRNGRLVYENKYDNNGMYISGMIYYSNGNVSEERKNDDKYQHYKTYNKDGKLTSYNIFNKYDDNIEYYREKYDDATGELTKKIWFWIDGDNYPKRREIYKYGKLSTVNNYDSVGEQDGSQLRYSLDGKLIEWNYCVHGDYDFSIAVESSKNASACDVVIPDNESVEDAVKEHGYEVDIKGREVK